MASSSSASASLTPEDVLAYFNDSNETLFSGSEGVQTQGYYDALTEAQPVCVKYLDAHRGKCLCAKRDIKKGEVVLVDYPLVSMRDIQSEAIALVCGNCYIPLGTPVEQISHILDRPLTASERDQIPCNKSNDEKEKKKNSDTTNDDFVRCICGQEVYCSPACQQRAASNHHALLCPTQSADPNALAAFTHHAMHTNEVFVLALRLYAHLALRVLPPLPTPPQSSSSSSSSSTPNRPSMTPTTLKEALRPFRLCAKEHWWTVLQPDPTDSDYEDPENFKQQLYTVLEESLTLIKAVLGPRAVNALAPILTPEFYSLIIGIFERNNLGVDVTNPLEPTLRDMEGSALAAHVWDAVKKIADEDEDEAEDEEEPHDHENDHEHDHIDEEVDEDDFGPHHPFHHLHPEVTLLLPLHSTVNHSCTPNATIAYVEGKTTVIAMDDISAEEPITTDYVAGEDASDRRPALRKWGPGMCSPPCTVCDADEDDD
ncbi:hypothetical protein DFJ77DRAFT_28792 [Powellomyces hirtus]|nr:hypothetical protein DFJ77DRAFT_28792 [Powellomyces hirtus]